jgi:signal transduction histidine kinase
MGGASRRGFGIAGAVIALAGSTLLVWTLTLPWMNPDFDLPATVRVAMAVAGLVLLALTASAGRGRIGVGSALLGTLTLLYPAMLGVGAAFPDDPVLSTLGSVWHVPPILLMQILPVLASSAAVGRPGLRRELILAGTLVVALGTAVAGSLPVPGATLLAAAGSVLWFAQLGVAPLITWTTVRGSAGDDRRRAVLAALAASVPLLLIVSCSLLGVAAEGLGLGIDGAVTLLMLGFSVAGLACGGLALASRARAGSPLLRAATIIRVLDALIAIIGVIALAAVALLTRILEAPPIIAVACGAVAAVVVAAIWRGSRNTTARIVDPASALRHHLRHAPAAGEGVQRRLALRALRAAVDDAALQVRFRVAADTWVDESDAEAGPGDLVIARRDDDEPVITVTPGSAASAGRIVALGDCSAILGPAAYEARLSHASRRADLAAEEERRRLQQNLHDGLQGRLLGVALGLQLSGRDLDDPSARLLIDETVDSLRSMVDDVRALGGGDLPEVLQSEGLAPALHVLLGPAVGSIVGLDVPPDRLGAEAEATAYFVIGEAVTNALKHADARRIGVRVAVTGRDRLTVTVRDDGRGGADPRAGTGLRALAERVAAAGGEFLVRDDLERGTIVEAVLPCAS